MQSVVVSAFPEWAQGSEGTVYSRRMLSFIIWSPMLSQTWHTHTHTYEANTENKNVFLTFTILQITQPTHTYTHTHSKLFNLHVQRSQNDDKHYLKMPQIYLDTHTHWEKDPNLCQCQTASELWLHAANEQNTHLATQCRVSPGRVRGKLFRFVFHF